MRHVPDIELPTVRHMPGTGTRAEVAMPEPAPLLRESWRQHRGLAFGFDLWERGFFWEAHEVWESAWKLTEEGAERELLRGLIQLAAARVQEALEHRDGAERLTARAAGHLRGASAQADRPIVCGIWVDQVIADGDLRWRWRSRDLPGVRTDLIVQPLECTFARTEAAIVQRTPDYPSYYGGRAHYRDRLVELGPARAETEALFADGGPGYVNLIWEVEEPGALEIELADGDKLDRFRILAGRELSRSPSPPPGIELRPIENDRDWLLASAFAGRLAVADWGPKGRAFVDWRYAHFRRTVQLWGGAFCGAFAGEELVGCLGVVDCGPLFRYQDVQVAVAFRRRGIANSLCAFAFEHAGANPKKPAIIAADAGSIAERMYRGLGFLPTATQHYLQWKI